MEAHQQRVLDEMKELQIKHEKLEGFLNSALFKTLDKAEQDRLMSQSYFMMGYLGCLVQRAEAFVK